VNHWLVGLILLAAQAGASQEGWPEEYPSDLLSGIVGVPTALPNDEWGTISDLMSFRTGVPIPSDAVPVYNLALPYLIVEVNEFRSLGRFCGDEWFPAVPPVKLGWDLAMIAQLHAEDMTFSHVGSDGRHSWERGWDVGYERVTENIYFGSNDADDVIAGWERSSGHCANMMDSTAQEGGGGRVGEYWVLNMGSRLWPGE